MGGTERFMVGIAAITLAFTVVVGGAFYTLHWLIFHVALDLVAPGTTLPPAPSLAAGMAIGAFIGLAACAAAIAAFALRPLSSMLREHLDPCEVQALEPEHPLSVRLAELAAKYELTPPRVHLIDAEKPAIVIYSNLAGTAVGYSAGMLKNLSAEELDWVSAHALAHIRAGDALATTFWLSACHSLLVFGRLRNRIIVALARMGERIQIPAALLDILLFPLALLHWVSRIAAGIARHTFRLVDMLIVPGMEMRADAQATRVTSREAGLSVLEKLPDGLEPFYVRLLARSRATRRRKTALSKMTAPTTAQGAAQPATR